MPPAALFCNEDSYSIIGSPDAIEHCKNKVKTDLSELCFNSVCLSQEVYEFAQQQSSFDSFCRLFQRGLRSYCRILQSSSFPTILQYTVLFCFLFVIVA